MEESQLRELKARAAHRGQSMASLVREAVSRYLAQPVAGGALEGFVGCAKGKVDDDTSERADEILRGLLG